MSVPEALSDEECNDEIIQIPIKEVIKGPLSKRFYLAMLALESQVKKQFTNMDEILDLVEMYGRCVEHFDLMHETVKWYFMEKIQTTLAESKTHEIILQKEKEFKHQQRLAQQVKPMVKIENIAFDPLRVPKAPVPKQNVSAQKMKSEPTQCEEMDLGDKSRTISIRMNRETTNKRLTLIEQVNKCKEALGQSQLLEQWDESKNQTDQLISSQLKDQSKTIQDRLAQRKNQNPRQLKYSSTSAALLQEVQQQEVSVPEFEKGQVEAETQEERISEL